MGLPGGSVVKNPPSMQEMQVTFNAGDAGWIPGLGRSPGVGHNNPLQYSCLENRRDRVPRGLQSKELDMTKAA